jgi:transglutaminase-like putative cysteine protease
MRIRIVHETAYRYESPAAGVIQTLRLTPRNFEGLFVTRWRIEVSADCRLDQREDAFGNVTHSFQADGPLSELRLLAEGEVETQDTHGIVRDTVEPFPPSLFLRETPLTAPSPEIAAMAAELKAAGDGDDLAFLHAIGARLSDEIAFDGERTQATTSAAEAFALKRGVGQDFAHIFVTAARAGGIPARYVSGYFQRDGVVEQAAGHAWAEGHISGLGWVAFDPTHRICTTDAHVRVAIGLDYLGAAPVRGARSGGSSESLAVKLRVVQASRQTQS